ncbi:MAG: hypothetical protein GOU99_01980 [Candidatus Altiarchaeota archaeon]|nr:hypothetical protein [Candidatus Altiarchaeota archaeon]
MKAQKQLFIQELSIEESDEDGRTYVLSTTYKDSRADDIKEIVMTFGKETATLAFDDTTVELSRARGKEKYRRFYEELDKEITGKDELYNLAKSLGTVGVYVLARIPLSLVPPIGNVFDPIFGGALGYSVKQSYQRYKERTEVYKELLDGESVDIDTLSLREKQVDELRKDIYRIIDKYKLLPAVKRAIRRHSKAECEHQYLEDDGSNLEPEENFIEQEHLSLMYSQDSTQAASPAA